MMRSRTTCLARNRAAETIAIAYDNLNRPTFKNLPGSEPDVTYGYDLLGRLTSASQTGNNLGFTYDALGRNLTQVGPQGTVSSQWDIAGRRTRLTYPGSGLYVLYDYLVTGDMTRIRENGATSGAGVLATYAYDNLGRRTSLTRGNSTVTSYSYDAVSRLTALTQNLALTANDLTIGSIGYNPASQIVGQTRSNDAYAWTGAVAVNRNYTSDGLNRYAQIGAITPSYDANGNLTQAGGATYGYSSENMLVSASGGALPSASLT